MLDWEIREGDCLELLKQMPDKSVQCCVTSPPYWGLRDYSTGTWEGGTPGCDHVSHEIRTGKGMAKLGAQYHGGGHKATSDEKVILYRAFCGKCGAVRKDYQIGLEGTPEEYVNRLVEVFREVWRVLRDDGVLWLNLGDCYSHGKPRDNETCKNGGMRWQNEQSQLRAPGLKHKDLVGIPWRVAFALQADGWYLRSDIIWSKPNPMPESVTDRPTKAHEYIFLLTKSERYFYNHEAIKEPGVTHLRDKRYGPDAPGRDRRDEPWNQQGPHKPHKGFKSLDTTKGRNKRTVWTVATKPFPGAHFAVFPPALIEPCILAGSKPGDAVLDPFSGAGTTGLVALRHGRQYIGLELSPEYVEMSKARIMEDAPLFNRMEATT